MATLTVVTPPADPPPNEYHLILTESEARQIVMLIGATSRATRDEVFGIKRMSEATRWASDDMERLYNVLIEELAPAPHGYASLKVAQASFYGASAT